MRGAGRVVFVAILLLMVGTLNIIYGIGAISDANFYANDTRYILTNLHTMGWVLVILGVIQLTGGFSLMAGNTWGRFVGIVAGSPRRDRRTPVDGRPHPFWELGIFFLCVWIVYGIVVFGEDERAPESESDFAGARPAAGLPRSLFSPGGCALARALRWRGPQREGAHDGGEAPAPRPSGPLTSATVSSFRCPIFDQQGGADRAAEVAERRQAHLGRAVIHEEMGVHACSDPVDVLLAEPLPRPPPMITASGSTRLTEEAIPEPSAFTARSTSLVPDRPRA